MELSLRVLPLTTAREWINQLAQDPTQSRNVIKASGILGDPHAVTWLIAQMRIPQFSRLAGEAFSTLTGVDLVKQNLALNDLPNLDDQSPNEDPNDNNVSMDEDERLPFPDADRIAAVWQKYQQRFVPGQRYFMGQTITAEYVNKGRGNK